MLSARQAQVYDFISRQTIANGRPPTQTEIASHFGFRQNAARDHLRVLARKGAITLESGSARGIRLVSKPTGSDGKRTPVIGRIAAGAPITAAEHIEDFIEVDPSTFKPRADYLFRVHGRSMIDIGVLDGDVVAVHADPHPVQGSIVAAAIPDPQTGELLLTLKRYRRELETIVLSPENCSDEFAPLHYGPNSGIQIVGRYVGLIRPQHRR